MENSHLFENRLHSEVKTLAKLQEYYSVWQANYSTWSIFKLRNWKIQREIAHIWYELFHTIYHDGNLSAGNLFISQNGNFLVSENGNSFISEG